MFKHLRAKVGVERTELGNRHGLDHSVETSSFLLREVATMLLSLWCQDHHASLNDSVRLESQLAVYPVAHCYLLLHRVELLVALGRRRKPLQFLRLPSDFARCLGHVVGGDGITLRKQIALAKLRLSQGAPQQKAARWPNITRPWTNCRGQAE